MSMTAELRDDEIAPVRRPLMLEGAGQKRITSKESSAMVLLVSLGVEAVANCTFILGKLYQPVLKDVLYPLIELLVDTRAGNDIKLSINFEFEFEFDFDFVFFSNFEFCRLNCSSSKCIYNISYRDVSSAP